MQTTDLAPLFPTRDEIPESFRVTRHPMERYYLCDGELKEWQGETQEISSPICIRNGGALTREIIGQTPAMDEKAALAGLDAAVRAWDNGRGEWPTMTVAGRIAAVQKFTEMMLEAREEVVRLLMWEIGKPLAESRKEFDRTVEYIHRTVEALKDVDRNNSRFSLDGGVIAQVRRAPLGVCLSMGPFNYPLNETYTTLIPALIMGNTLVVKPPKFGVLLHQPLLKAFAESFPRGVVNFIYGDGRTIITPIMKSGKVDVLAFIGSSGVADILKHQHPYPHRMRGILGLDAKNPAFILPDANLDITVRECLAGTLNFNGQRCTGLKLLFIHESLAQQFIERYSAGVDGLKMGMPWTDGVKLTPLPEFGKAELLNSYVADAVSKGAKVVNPGGGQACETLYKPAVVFPVNSEAQLWSKEQFGPVVPICTYREEEELLRFSAASNYGQQASIFGSDPKKLAHLLDPLANMVCRINLNAQCQRGPDTLPFTGRKDSAEATLSITDALRCFSIRSLVAAEANEESRHVIQEIVAGRYSKFLHTDFIL